MSGISIVDDDESVHEGTMDLFKAMGFSAKAFQRDEGFLKSKRLPSTSCMIADVRMPGMTGLEPHNRLVRSDNDIATNLITAFPDEGDRTRALQAGVVCYPIKPFTESESVACIGLALERHGAPTGDS